MLVSSAAAPLRESAAASRTFALASHNGAGHKACVPLNKEEWLDSLIDACEVALLSLFVPQASSTPSKDRAKCGASGSDAGYESRKGMPLRTFIAETIRRTQTSLCTLQLSVYYLFLFKSCLNKETAAGGSGQASRRDLPAESCFDGAQSLKIRAAHSCGRKMFLAALLLATKYHQDRTFSNTAWSKLSGLSAFQLLTLEGSFLHVINWQLFVPQDVWAAWSSTMSLLCDYAALHRASRISKDHWSLWAVFFSRCSPRTEDIISVKILCELRQRLSLLKTSRSAALAAGMVAEVGGGEVGLSPSTAAAVASSAGSGAILTPCNSTASARSPPLTARSSIEDNEWAEMRQYVNDPYEQNALPSPVSVASVSGSSVGLPVGLGESLTPDGDYTRRKLSSASSECGGLLSPSSSTISIRSVYLQQPQQPPPPSTVPDAPAVSPGADSPGANMMASDAKSKRRQQDDAPHSQLKRRRV